MVRTHWDNTPQRWALGILVMTVLTPVFADDPTITPSAYWKNEIAFPYDAFANRGTAWDSTKWVKFTILLEPYDPNVVYFQKSTKYVYHYTFAAEVLDPFLGMTTAQFNAVSLYAENQQALLGAVILPPPVNSSMKEPQFLEYGIQFIRQDAFAREEIRDLFNRVKACIAASDDVQAFYFPTYEQQATASANSDWFASQGIPISSTTRWASGNTCYSEGWAFGTLKFFPADQIATAYRSGDLKPDDILLTDGVPAEIPFVAGIISLAASTPNSHVAILSRTYAIPFVHLVLADDVARVQDLVGRRILLTAYEDDYGTDVELIETETCVDDEAAAQLLAMKESAPLSIEPMASLGVFGLPTEGLTPSDIRYVGGKASNFGILRASVPDNSPRSIAITFDLWQAFLDQPLTPSPTLTLAPGKHLVLWADGDTDQGPTHTSFRLSKDGESVGLYDADGATRIDAVQFGPQTEDASFGRSPDGGDAWALFTAPTPGRPNTAGDGASGSGLLINEIMADNQQTIEDPCESGEFPDWIELYNASDETITLNGLYLTDDLSEPTQWQIPPEIVGPTLRDEIARRLAKYASYPPSDMQALAQDLACIRNLFTHANVTVFSDQLREGILAVLTDPQYGFEPNVMLRFRSSTNVEDSADFIGAGLYDSYSGCLADALDSDDEGPCACDPNRASEKDIFHAIRQVFASFYNNNAFLERLRHEVNEADVGMAMVVHHSVPDDIELANGVATIGRTASETTFSLVTQLGAVSVTNPEDGSTPEEVTVVIYASGSLVPAKLMATSSLVRLGETVMTWRDDYTALANLLLAVSKQYAQTTGQSEYILDVEYKKVAAGGRALPAGGLLVKQVRPIPTSDYTQTPFLVNQPTQFEVYTGEVVYEEATDVFADHRLKSRWTLETKSTVLDAQAIQEGLYTNVQIEYLDEDQVRTISGQMALLPGAAHEAGLDSTRDSWHLADLSNPRTYNLKTTKIPTAVETSECPIFTPSDLGCSGFGVPYKFLTLHVTYANHVESWSADGVASTSSNRVYLWPCQEADSDDIAQERTLTSNGISITSRFYYPPLPAGITAWEMAGGNTAPLKQWDQTTITGLTPQPIVLTGYYSQTFRPEHHNVREHLLFEPRLEPGISADILRELQDQDIRFIHMILDKDGDNTDESRIVTYGF
ncbi:MAG TPA: PEP/pyruvate-binding domain-containing protein [Sedimentisphaerales bacterium]|nr:PEP/pyruvate-binding domain-containing protein [Sedimentisphaerales bacterium]HNU29518.1 PEP/pyruvate-binding domain-containing protein [Sedimentisphaerales bacterium]